MAWRGSVSRSLMSTARASAFRSSSPRLRPPSVSSSRLNSRRFSFSNPRPRGVNVVLDLTLGQLGCSHSLLPPHSMVAGARMTSHLGINVRAFCELSHGT